LPTHAAIVVRCSRENLSNKSIKKSISICTTIRHPPFQLQNYHNNISIVFPFKVFAGFYGNLTKKITIVEDCNTAALGGLV
jgi:hypothetical protein